VAAGIPAAVAPRGRLASAAAEAFAAGFYAAACRGRGLVDAVVDGRRAVRELASPRPDARWHAVGLWVGSLEVLEAGPCVRDLWRPEGWPAPAPAPAVWLDAAARGAARAGAGFVGVEFLVDALDALDAGGPLTLWARAALSARREALLAGLAHLRPVAGRAPTLRATPRLRSWGSRLAPGFEADAALRILLESGALVEPLPPPPGAAEAATGTLEVDWTAEVAAAVAPDALEVVGGPEDGLRLAPRVGERLGRWAAGSETEHMLYAACASVDPFLSRRHITWLGDGRVTLARPGRILRLDGTEEQARGEVRLGVGDVLMLSPATRLRAIL